MKYKKRPLGYFELNDINTIKALPDNHFSNKKNVIEIKVNKFFKKNIEKGERTFYFSSDSTDGLFKMLIFLNFLRVKSIYDNFTDNFGTIQLPMYHNINNGNKHKYKLLSYYELEKIKNQFIKSNPKGSGSFLLKNKNTPRKSSLIFDQNFGRKNDNTNLIELKENIEFLWIFGMISVIGNIQMRLYQDPENNELKEYDFISKSIRELYNKHR